MSEETKPTTKITQLTIVNQQGTSAYFVGREYNGILLDRIRDNSIDAPENYTACYQGLDKEGNLVFETINAPIEVVYSLDT